MTKVWLCSSFLLAFLFVPLALRADGAQGVLRLSAYVAPRAFVEVATISRNQDLIELKLQKNTQNLNFTMIVAAEDNGESWIRRPAHSLRYVFSALGQSRMINLKELKQRSRQIHMTVISP